MLNYTAPDATLVVPAAAPAAWLDLAAPRAQVQLKGSAPYDTGGAMTWQSNQLALPTAPSPTTGRFSVIVGRNPKVCDCVIDSDQESDVSTIAMLALAHARTTWGEKGQPPRPQYPHARFTTAAHGVGPHEVRPHGV